MLDEHLMVKPRNWKNIESFCKSQSTKILTRSMWTYLSIGVLWSNLSSMGKPWKQWVVGIITLSRTIAWQGKEKFKYQSNVVVYFSYASLIRASCNCWSWLTVSVTELSIKSTEPKRNMFLSSILFTKEGTTLISSALASATRILSFLPLLCKHHI